MPDYLPPRAGVAYSVAFAESAAIARIDDFKLECYELWHPSMVDGPFRFVNDVQAVACTLEATAPRDPGVEVEFLAVPMTVTQPEESDTADNPSVTLSRPDVAGILKNALDAARGTVGVWEIIERVYMNSDKSAPHIMPPRKYEVTTFNLSLSSASLTASYGDHANEAVPRLTFKREFYPGLVR